MIAGWGENAIVVTGVVVISAARIATWTIRRQHGRYNIPVWMSEWPQSSLAPRTDAGSRDVVSVLSRCQTQCGIGNKVADRSECAVADDGSPVSNTNALLRHRNRIAAPVDNVTHTFAATVSMEAEDSVGHSVPVVVHGCANTKMIILERDRHSLMTS